MSLQHGKTKANCVHRDRDVYPIDSNKVYVSTLLQAVMHGVDRLRELVGIPAVGPVETATIPGMHRI